MTIERSAAGRPVVVRVAAMVVLAVGAAFFLHRTHSVSAPRDHANAQGVSDPSINPYERLYRARLWAERDPAGALALAREARRFGMTRSCAKAAARAVSQLDGAARDDARRLAEACAAGLTGEQEP